MRVIKGFTEKEMLKLRKEFITLDNYINIDNYPLLSKLWDSLTEESEALKTRKR